MTTQRRACATPLAQNSMNFSLVRLSKSIREDSTTSRIAPPYGFCVIGRIGDDAATSPKVGISRNASPWWRTPIPIRVVRAILSFAGIKSGPFQGLGSRTHRPTFASTICQSPQPPSCHSSATWRAPKGVATAAFGEQPSAGFAPIVLSMRRCMDPSAHAPLSMDQNGGQSARRGP